jgi:hypothetical protein
MKKCGILYYLYFIGKLFHGFLMISLIFLLVIVSLFRFFASLLPLLCFVDICLSGLFDRYHCDYTIFFRELSKISKLTSISSSMEDCLSFISSSFYENCKTVSDIRLFWIYLSISSTSLLIFRMLQKEMKILKNGLKPI